jgi:hypothetical protein
MLVHIDLFFGCKDGDDRRGEEALLLSNGENDA